jgi:Domain of Unknown Function (DUF1080)
MAGEPLGYDDTPLIPGTGFRVHDALRPQPRRVHPGTPSPQAQAGEPPSDAVVLFGGTDLSAWVSAQGGDAGWRVAHGDVEVVPGAGDIQTRQQFGDCQLHVEWAAPAQVTGEGEQRGAADGPL